MAKILIVEDDKALQDVYADVLRGEGHQVETADDGWVGLEKMQQGGWDLVLLDIILPKISGTDIMKMIHEKPPVNPNKSVVFLTNIDRGEEIKKALAIGNGYIIKSEITPGDLIGEVNMYLSPLEQKHSKESPESAAE